MSDTAALKRQLQIKTGVVKRLTAESYSYVQEVSEQETRVQKFITEGRDDWDVRKQKEVLEDCKKMVPDSRNRLAKALDELQGLLEGIGEEEGTVKEEVEMARGVCAKAEAGLKG